MQNEHRTVRWPVNTPLRGGVVAAAERLRSTRTVQRTGASRFAQRQIERHRRLAPVADLGIGLLNPTITVQTQHIWQHTITLSVPLQC